MSINNFLTRANSGFDLSHQISDFIVPYTLQRDVSTVAVVVTRPKTKAQVSVCDQKTLETRNIDALCSNSVIAPDALTINSVISASSIRYRFDIALTASDLRSIASIWTPFCDLISGNIFVSLNSEAFYSNSKSAPGVPGQQCDHASNTNYRLNVT